MSAEDVIGALRDIIVLEQPAGRKHEPTPNEYFAAILSSLAKAQTTREEHIDELLIILRGVIPSSSVELARASFRQLSQILVGIIKAYQDSTKTLRHSLGCLGVLLLIQETSDGFWASLTALQSINAFLTLLHDERTSVRRTVVDEMVRLLTAHKRVGMTGLASYVSEYCASVLKACTRSKYKHALYVTAFLTTAVGSLPPTSALPLLEDVLILRECQQPVLTAAAFKCIDSSMQNTKLVIPGKDTAAFLRALLKAGTASLDMEANVYFFSGICSCVVRIFEAGEPVSGDFLESKLAILIEGLAQDFTQIHTAVGASLKRMLCHPKVDVTPRVLTQVLSALAPRYQPAWFYVVDVLRSLLIRLSSQPELVTPIVARVALRYQECEDRLLQVTPQVEVAFRDTLSSGVRVLRLTAFLKTVPLDAVLDEAGQRTAAGTGVLERRQWVMQVLHTALKLFPTTCADFRSEVLERIDAWEKELYGSRGARMSSSDRTSLRRNVTQLWSLLPDFCSHVPADLVDDYDSLAMRLVMVLKDPTGNPEVLPYVITALTNLATVIAREGPAQARDVLSPSCRVVLPVLLNLIETSTKDGTQAQIGLTQACVAGAAAWAAIAPPVLISSLGKKLFKVVLTSTSRSATDMAVDGAAAAAEDALTSMWMSVILAILPHLERGMVALLYKTLKPIMSTSSSTVMQKRGYLILDALLKSYADIVLEVDALDTLLNILSESLYECHVSSRHMRLRCVHSLVKAATANDALLADAARAVFGEVLICLKDNNRKCREAAADVLKALAERCDPELLVSLARAGLVAETAVVRSAALLSFSLLLIERRHDDHVLAHAPPLLMACATLAQDDCREQTRALLVVLRVIAAVLPPMQLKEQLGILLETALWPSAHKERFAARIRGVVRKVLARCGEDLVRSRCPREDIALVDYILRRERKALRLRAERDATTAGGSSWNAMLDSDSDDSDDDSDMDEGPSTKAARPKAVRASSEQAQSSSLPRNLDDLLDDGGNQAMTSVAEPNGDARDAGSKDQDDPYAVDFDKEGKLVVTYRDAEASAPAAVASGDKKGPSNADLGWGDPFGRGKDGAATGTARPKRVRVAGEEYKAKKGRGDVWKKGMLAPHAFIPLDARMLKGNKTFDKAVDHFGAVLKNGGSAAKKVGRGKKGQVLGNRNQRRALAKHTAAAKSASGKSVGKKPR